ncbi:Uncharacterized protein APZ42_022489 [Daphnia magna]|uniref:Uncharacterized protein n=1 Tax=Daphnia magna TaxID=35525 RepID=A0A164VJ22_9CRUS|nr:Uncharacterized protein APZ42_022489 [Daphnia magna]
MCAKVFSLRSIRQDRGCPPPPSPIFLGSLLSSGWRRRKNGNEARVD